MDEAQTLSTGGTTDGALIGTENRTRHIAQRVFQGMTGIDQFILAVVSTEDADLNECSSQFEQGERRRSHLFLHATLSFPFRFANEMFNHFDINLLRT